MRLKSATDAIAATAADDDADDGIKSHASAKLQP